MFVKFSAAATATATSAATVTSAATAAATTATTTAATATTTTAEPATKSAGDSSESEKKTFGSGATRGPGQAGASPRTPYRRDRRALHGNYHHLPPTSYHLPPTAHYPINKVISYLKSRALDCESALI